MPSPDKHQDPLGRVLAAVGSVDEARRRERAMFPSLARGATRAVVFGCGALGRIVLTAAREAGVDVAACADNNGALWGQQLEGVPILSVPDAVSRHGDDAFFVVAVFNGAAPRQQLRDLGCERIVPYPAFYWEFASRFTWAPGIELPHRIVERAEEVRAGYDCLSDGSSRKEFAAQIAWRSSLDDSVLPPPDDPAEIYFPRDLMRLSEDEVLADCGAFDGDSLRLFRARTSGAFRYIYAFEPDAANRLALDHYLSSLPARERERISVMPFAVGDRDGSVLFSASGNAGSRISEGGSTESIECRRLDTALHGIPPTIIKMDIEGAEPDAIAGATATIRRGRPFLAICAYHSCEHLWTLPRLIRAALPDYRVFLRRYAEECWEMVYYAVPPERAADAP